MYAGHKLSKTTAFLPVVERRAPACTKISQLIFKGRTITEGAAECSSGHQCYRGRKTNRSPLRRITSSHLFLLRLLLPAIIFRLSTTAATI
ncbi:unnamed protein product, partial [Amoebophrya sp. A120]|eukprot:GSA120T00011695001.1